MMIRSFVAPFLIAGRAQAKKDKQSKRGGGATDIPDLSDYEAVQKFFIQEVQIGEELLALGANNNCKRELQIAS